MNKKQMYALGRLKQGEMNRTESAYAAVLEKRKQDGEILWFKFEGVKLRLADSTFLSPDFFVMASNGELSVHEVKGFMQEDAHVKLKVAADAFPFPFYVIRAKPKKDGGGWSIDQVGK